MSFYGVPVGRRVTMRDLSEATRRGEKWPMITAYDALTARIYALARTPRGENALQLWKADCINQLAPHIPNDNHRAEITNAAREARRVVERDPGADLQRAVDQAKAIAQTWRGDKAFDLPGAWYPAFIASRLEGNAVSAALDTAWAMRRCGVSNAQLMEMLPTP